LLHYHTKKRQNLQWTSPPNKKRNAISHDKLRHCLPVLGTKQHGILQQGILSKIPSKTCLEAFIRKSTSHKTAAMPQEHPSSQCSSSSVQQVGQYQIPLVQTSSPFQNYMFLAEDPLCDMKQTVAVQSTRSNGSTTPQIKQPEHVSTLITATRPHKRTV